jgi:hypothetical protein
MGNTQATRSSGEVDDRFGVAVSTGFRRTDPATGRTAEFLLCPEKGPKGSPEQSSGFVAEVKGGRARCPYCESSHPVVDFFDAEARGFIVAKDTGQAYSEAVNFAADLIADGIRMISRPAKRTARG